MKVNIDEYEIELPANTKGLNIHKHWDVFGSRYYYTIEFYVDKNINTEYE